jgi:hypothetical protein
MASRRLFDGAQIELGILPIVGAGAPPGGGMVGTAALVFASVALLRGIAKGQGTAALVFGASGDLKAAALTMRGTANLVFGASGIFVGAAAGQILSNPFLASPGRLMGR